MQNNRSDIELKESQEEISSEDDSKEPQEAIISENESKEPQQETISDDESGEDDRSKRMMSKISSTRIDLMMLQLRVSYMIGEITFLDTLPQFLESHIKALDVYINQYWKDHIEIVDLAKKLQLKAKKLCFFWQRLDDRLLQIALIDLFTDTEKGIALCVKHKIPVGIIENQRTWVNKFIRNKSIATILSEFMIFGKPFVGNLVNILETSNYATFLHIDDMYTLAQKIKNDSHGVTTVSESKEEGSIELTESMQATLNARADDAKAEVESLKQKLNESELKRKELEAEIIRLNRANQSLKTTINKQERLTLSHVNRITKLTSIINSSGQITDSPQSFFSTASNDESLESAPDDTRLIEQDRSTFSYEMLF